MLEPTIHDIQIIDRFDIVSINNILSALIDDSLHKRDIKEFVMVPLLTGAIYFAADLSRCITTPHSIEAIKVTSYVGTDQHAVKHALDLSMDYRGKHIILVDEICDSGTTLDTMKKIFQALGATVDVAVLIDRPISRKSGVVADLITWSGTTINNTEFLYGYGLDLDEKYRNKPGVWALVRN